MCALRPCGWWCPISLGCRQWLVWHWSPLYRADDLLSAQTLWCHNSLNAVIWNEFEFIFILLFLKHNVTGFKYIHVWTEKGTHLTKTSHHLLYQWAHRSNIDDFEVIYIYGSIQVYVLPNFPQHSHQGNIGLSSSLCAPITKFNRRTYCLKKSHCFWKIKVKKVGTFIGSSRPNEHNLWQLLIKSQY